MISREAVIWAYRILLEREPESDIVIKNCQKLPDTKTLRHNILKSSEYLSKNVTDDPEGAKIVRYQLSNGNFIYLNLLDRSVSRFALLERYEPQETEIVRALLEPGCTFIDIGANIGWFTLQAASIIGSKGRIYSFEPRQDIFNLLKMSVEDSHLKFVNVYNNALGSSRGKATLGWHEQSTNLGGSRIAQFSGEEKKGLVTQKVSLIALDDIDLQGKVKLIKIDVEGYELEVMKGAKRVLKSHRPIVLSEVQLNGFYSPSGQVSCKDYLDFFENIDYDCFELGQDLKSLPKFNISEFLRDENKKALVNVVFVPKEKSIFD